MTENSREFREGTARHLGHGSYDHLIRSLHDRGIDADDYFMEMLKKAFEDVMKKQDQIKNLQEINSKLLADLANVQP